MVHREKVPTSDLGLVAFGFAHQESGCITVKRIGRIGISEELR